MKNLLAFSIVLFLFNSLFAQKFSRPDLDYAKYEKENYDECETDKNKIIDKIYQAIESNQSEEAVKIADQVKDKFECVDLLEAISTAMFMSGDWMGAIDLLDNGIKKVGAYPGLIMRRINFSLEMYQMGVGARNKDGMTMYLPEKQRLKFDDEQFKAENLRSAIYDLEYLVSNYESRYEQILMLGQLYAISENFEKSNEVLEQLKGVEDYGINALFIQAKNFTSLKKFDEAEKRFKEILKGNEKNYKLLQEVGKFYKSQGNEKQAENYFEKAEFNYYVPSYLDFEFTQENFDLIKFFQGDEKGDKKKAKLKTILKKSDKSFTAEVCLIILKMHANHGNGLEEYAAEVLAETGNKSLDKIHRLFGSNVATCTIGNLAFAMAEIKDEESWKMMVEYLPYIADMPMTLIPPKVPEMMIKFDEEKGLEEVLKAIKKVYNKPPSNDPMMGGFGDYIFFYPLRDLDSKKVLAKAKSLNFNEEELKKLEEELKK